MGFKRPRTEKRPMLFGLPVLLAALVLATPAPWSPTSRDTLQWDLEAPVPLNSLATVFDVDLFDNPATFVASLHHYKRHAICYIDVGSWENYRPDAKSFPAVILGKTYPGYPDERYLDIRRLDLLGPILQKRFDLCKSKGFDGIEPDNIDSYQADTGFPLTARDARAFDSWLILEAHRRGLSIGQKNDPDQAAIMEPYFDWALTEECFCSQYCDEMAPYAKAGKRVFNVEYRQDTTAATFLHVDCPGDKYRFDMSYKDVSLNAYRLTCSGRLDPAVFTGSRHPRPVGGRSRRHVSPL
jgi:hypothetical protein